MVSRLLGDLKAYLSRRGDGSGAELVVWYHLQFWEAAEAFLFEGGRSGARSLNARINAKATMHSELADYFGGKWAGKPKPYNDKLCKCVQHEKFFPGESEGDRMVSAQPLAAFRPSSRVQGEAAQREALDRVRAPPHLRWRGGACSSSALARRICAGEEELAVKELCSIEYVAAKFAAEAGAALMREFGEASEQFPVSSATERCRGGGHLWAGTSRCCRRWSVPWCRFSLHCRSQTSRTSTSRP